MLLAAGDEVACTWYLVPAETQGESPPDSTAPSPAVTAAEEVDSDGDGLTDELEMGLGTDPLLVDSDADGVSDSDEIDFYGTDALDPDTDGDGLDDAEELLTYGTNPLLDDTDGDAVSDGDEVVAGSDPLDAVSAPATPTPLPTATPPATPEPTPPNSVADQGVRLAIELAAADGVHDFELVAGLERRIAIFSAGHDFAIALDDGHGIGHPLAGEKIVDRRTGDNRDRLAIDDDLDGGGVAPGADL